MIGGEKLTYLDIFVMREGPTVATKCVLSRESNPTHAKKQAGKPMLICFLIGMLYQKKVYIVS